MKNLKKLIMASFMLVIAFVAVVSSTYAWFTKSSEASVTNISIDVVDADSSLLISTSGDTGSFSAFVTPEFAEGAKFTPVTLAKSVAAIGASAKDEEVMAFKKISAIQKAVDSNEQKVTLEDALEMAVAGGDITNGYAKFDLWFQIFADTTANLLSTHINLSELTVAATIDEDDSAVALSCFRLAVVETSNDNKLVTILEDGTEDAGAYGVGQAFYGDANESWLEFMVNGDIATRPSLGADEHSSSAKPYTVHEDVKRTDEVDHFNAATGEIAGENPITVVTDGKVYKNSGCAAADIITAADTEITGYAKVTFYLWMEGWDGDCINSAASANYVVNFKLAVERTEN